MALTDVAAPARLCPPASAAPSPPRPARGDGAAALPEPGGTDDELAGWGRRCFVAALEARLRLLFSEQREQWTAVDPWLADLVDTLSGFVLGGGKRLRPLFCAYGYLAAGGRGQPARLVDASAALELLHSFALLHDDVMDGSDTRRGQPSLHRRLEDEHVARGHRGEARRAGEGAAVLVGDLGFALAHRLIAGSPLTTLQVWHGMTDELVMGQYLDLAGSARGGAEAGRALNIARCKSGSYTVERPLQLGASIAGLPAVASVDLFGFARPLGEAFQFRDDLLGAFGDEGTTGKPAGDDLRQGKPTLLLALGRQRARGRAAAVLDRVGRPGLDEEGLAAARWALDQCGARAALERLIDARYRSALQALRSAPMPAGVRQALAELARASLWRQA